MTKEKEHAEFLMQKFYELLSTSYDINSTEFKVGEIKAKSCAILHCELTRQVLIGQGQRAVLKNHMLYEGAIFYGDVIEELKKL